jgi:hypothetical protein
MGHFYLELITWSIKNPDKNDSDVCKLREIEFPELKLKWPEVYIVRSPDQAIYVFKLANT